MKKDIAAMICTPMLATTLTVIFNLNLFTSILLFFGLPALYVCVRNFGIIKKSFKFAFLFSIPLSLFVDALAAVDGSWVIPHSIFPFRFFGIASLEVYFFSLLWVFFAILFYEHFFDRGRSGDPVSARIKYLAYVFILLVLWVTLFFGLYHKVPHVSYFYSLFGIGSTVIPLILFLWKYPKFAGRFALAGTYFFFTLLLFEISALTTGQWIFPGQDFIALMPLFGHAVPVEELIIWMCVATPALFSYYEFFADDLKLSS